MNSSRGTEDDESSKTIPSQESQSLTKGAGSLKGDLAAGLFDISLGLLGVFLLGVLEDGRGGAGTFP